MHGCKIRRLPLFLRLILLSMICLSASAATVKPDWKGLVDPWAKGLAGYECIDNYVTCTPFPNGRNISWTDLEPTEGNYVFETNPNNNVIDNFLNASRNSGKQVYLRIFCGKNCPQWLLNKVGSVHLKKIENGVASEYDCPKWWTAAYMTEYRQLMQHLAAKYDGDSRLYAVTISACMTYYAEPMMRAEGQSAYNANSLHTAGMTLTADTDSHIAAIQAHADYWAETRSSLSVNPFQSINDAGTGFNTADSDTSLMIMDQMISILGTRAIVQNNSIRTKWDAVKNQWVIGMGTPYLKLYDRMKQYSQRGYCVGFQTAQIKLIGDVESTIQQAINYRAHFVELPNGYQTTSNISLASIQAFDNTLENGDYTAPAQVTNVSSVAAGGKITLSWDSPGGDCTGVKILRKTGSSPTHAFDPTATQVYYGNATSYTDSNLTNGTRYYYKIYSHDAVPNFAAGVAINDVPSTDLPPAAPTGLTATSGSGQIALNWNDNSEGDLAGYNVYRSKTSGSGYQLLNSSALLASSAYTDTTVSADNTYYYVVTAVDNGDNESDYSAQASATADSQVVTLTLHSIAAEDGYVLESTATSNIGGSCDATLSNSSAIKMGDDTGNKQYKSILSFDTSSIPDTVTITSAQVKVNRGYQPGTPFDGSLGTMYADIKTGYFGTSAALENGDFEAAASHTQVATMPDPGGYQLWSTGTLSSSGRADINKTGKTQIRLYFSTGDNGNAAIDYLGCFSSDYTDSTYFPQLVVTYNTDGTAPVAPTGLTATAGDSQVVLDWNDNTDSDLVGYNVYRSTVSGRAYVKINASTVTSSAYTDTGRVNGRPYYYIVRAIDEVPNESTNSNEASATPADMTSPGVPTGLTATSGDTTVSLNWNDVTASDLAGYNVYRSTVSGSGYVLVNTGDIATSDFLDVDTENNVTYYYKVTAFDEVPNESGFSSVVSIMAFDNTPPSVPTGLVATPGDNKVDLEWDPNMYPDVEGYNIYRSTLSASGFAKIGSNTDNVDVTYSDTTAVNGTTYYYKIKAYDEVPNESAYSNQVSAVPVDTTPPAPPTGLTATPGDAQITLAWTLNTEPDMQGYNIYRATVSGGPYTKVNANNPVSGPTFVNSNRTNGVTYYYVITAVDTANNESGSSAEVSATPVDSTPPAIPTGLTATRGDTQVSLDWADNTEPDLAAYEVWRSTVSGSGYTCIKHGQTTSNYLDTGLVNGVTYYYKLKAYDTSANYSALSGYVSATPADTTAPGAPTNLHATNILSTQVDLAWTAPGDADVASYKVYRSTVSGSGYSVIASNVTGTTYSDTGRTNNVTYYYCVSALDEVPNEGVKSAQYTAPGQVMLTINEPTASEDGWVLESGETTNVGGSLNSSDSTASALKIGDDGSKKQYKAILSFDTAGVPDNATVVWAKLFIKRGSCTTQSPFSWSGSPTLNVDVKTGLFGAASVENGDFQAAATASNVVSGGMFNPTSNDVWSYGVFNQAGMDAVNKTGKTQVRVYFSTDDDNDATADYMGFYSQDNATSGNRPYMYVTYQPAY